MSEERITANEEVESITNLVRAKGTFGFVEHNKVLEPEKRIEYVGENKNYTPMTVTMGGGYNLNSWAGFPLLKANRPYMVRSDGMPDYELNGEDYTEKACGGSSDVANTGYDGGAYSWLMKIYKNEFMSGNDRYVLFRLDKAEGFEPIGFIDSDGRELEGVWLPMFYGAIVDGSMRSMAGLQPAYDTTALEEKAAIDKAGGRARFFGGPVMETIADLLIMFSKTPDLMSVFGYGNSNGYDKNLQPTNGVKKNEAVKGGQFYGTKDGKSLNKIFHSVVIGTYQQWLRDPYEVAINGRIKVSKNYVFDLTGDTYADTGITLPTPESLDFVYPDTYRTVPGYGAFPVAPYNASIGTGACSGLFLNTTQASIKTTLRRFGACNKFLSDGPRTKTYAKGAEHIRWTCGAAVLLLPPAGVSI